MIDAGAFVQHEADLRLLLTLFEFYRDRYAEYSAFFGERLETALADDEQAWMDFLIFELMVRWANWTQPPTPSRLEVMGNLFTDQIGAKPELYDAWVAFLAEYFVENPEVISAWLERLPVAGVAAWAYRHLNQRLAEQHLITGFMSVTDQPGLVQ